MLEPALLSVIFIMEVDDKSSVSAAVPPKGSPGSDKRKANKVCRVCGDRAYGYNFNAITCESCKAFFRRNAVKCKEFKCPFSGKCEISPVSRRFCQKCRLEKCLAVGMKQDMILTDDKLAKKREQYHKKCQNGLISPTPDPIRSSVSCDTESVISSNCEDIASPLTASGCYLGLSNMENLLDINGSLLDNGVKCDGSLFEKVLNGDTFKFEIDPVLEMAKNCSCSCRCGAIPAMNFTDFIKYFERTMRMAASSDFNTTGTKRCTPHIENNNTHVAINAEDTIQAPLTSENVHNGEHFSTNDQILIDELLKAASHMTEPVESPSAGHPLVPVFTMMDLAIRRLVQMCKKIHAFTELCHEDQTALLKGGCTEMMILRGVMNYEPCPEPAWRAKEQVCNTNLYIKLEAFRAYDVNIYEEHICFLQTWDPSWRTNETLMLLVTAVTLFDPKRVNVKMYDQVKGFRDMYLEVLKRYIAKIYPDKVFAEYVQFSILQKLKQLNRLNENAVNFFANFEPKDVGQLLVEIFDLRV